MIILHFRLQPQFIYELFRINFTSIPLWLCYIDNTFTAICKDEIDTFHDHLNKRNINIQLTKEIEENGKLPFLDCLVSCDNNELRATVYRKLMHTDRLLDPNHPTT